MRAKLTSPGGLLDRLPCSEFFFQDLPEDTCWEPGVFSSGPCRLGERCPSAQAFPLLLPKVTTRWQHLFVLHSFFFFFGNLIFIFCWTRPDFPCRVWFWCTGTWFSYIQTYVYSSFPYRLSQCVQLTSCAIQKVLFVCLICSSEKKVGKEPSVPYSSMFPYSFGPFWSN